MGFKIWAGECPGRENLPVVRIDLDEQELSALDRKPKWMVDWIRNLEDFFENLRAGGLRTCRKDFPR